MRPADDTVEVLFPEDDKRAPLLERTVIFAPYTVKGVGAVSYAVQRRCRKQQKDALFGDCRTNNAIFEDLTW